MFTINYIINYESQFIENKKLFCYKSLITDMHREIFLEKKYFSEKIFFYEFFIP